MKQKLENMIETRIRERNALAYEFVIDPQPFHEDTIKSLDDDIGHLIAVTKMEDLPSISTPRGLSKVPDNLFSESALTYPS